MCVTVFFGHNPNTVDLHGGLGDGGATPRHWQLRLMPGAIVVPDARSTLLSPLPGDSLLFPRPLTRVVSELGVVSRSVLRVSHLAWPSISDCADSLAVLSFAAQLEAWKRDMPLFSSPEGGELAFDPTTEASVDAVISSRLASVRAVLSDTRTRFPGSSPPD